MRVTQLTAFRVVLPLRKRIKHASAVRDSSENVLVRCRLADGAQGWGEGVPRPYVTGESPEGALDQFAATPWGAMLADCNDWTDVVNMCQGLRPAQVADDPRGCHGNALRCAVELSVLDAYGRSFGDPVSRAAAFFAPAADILADADRVRYSGAVTAESRLKENISALKMRLYGFAQCKVKIGLPGVDDAPRLRRIRRRLGKRMDVRLDANEAFSGEEAARRIEPLLASNVSCVEQPVPHAEADSLAELRAALPVKIMLDESLTSLADAKAAIERKTADLFNIRLSKCGGFVNSLRLAALADQAGLGYQLGCHPGESGILSAAGRHWACAVAHIRYLEGSYDRHILKQRLTEEDLTFGYGGWARALTGPGLSMHVDESQVRRLAVEVREIEV